MKEKNIRELAKRMGLITVENMCQYTITQLVYMVANKVNELIDEVGQFESDVVETVKTQNENIQYLLGEGLHLEVENIFDGWINDGTFDTLINQTALKRVNDRIDETNTQLSEISVNVCLFGAYNDGSHAEETSEAIQNAIDYASKIGATVIFNTGIYAINKGIKIPSNTSIDFRNSTIIPLDWVDSKKIMFGNVGGWLDNTTGFSGVNNVVLMNGTIDAKHIASPISFQGGDTPNDNLTFKKMNIKKSCVIGLGLGRVNNSRVEECYFYNCYDNNIDINNSVNVVVENCLSEMSRKNNYFAGHSSRQIKFRNCKADGNDNQPGELSTQHFNFFTDPAIDTDLYNFELINCSASGTETCVYARKMHGLKIIDCAFSAVNKTGIHCQNGIEDLQVSNVKISSGTVESIICEGDLTRIKIENSNLSNLIGINGTVDDLKVLRNHIAKSSIFSSRFNENPKCVAKDNTLDGDTYNQLDKYESINKVVTINSNNVIGHYIYNHTNTEKYYKLATFIKNNVDGKHGNLFVKAIISNGITYLINIRVNNFQCHVQKVGNVVDKNFDIVIYKNADDSYTLYAHARKWSSSVIDLSRVEYIPDGNHVITLYNCTEESPTGTLVFSAFDNQQPLGTVGQ